MESPEYARSVFINCPFDGEYLPIFRAVVFTVSVCGFVPRQKFISDIAGQDIKAHGNSPETVIRTVRDWLRGAAGQGKIPGGSYLWARYQKFTKDLPGLCKEAHLVPAHLTFRDLYELVLDWMALPR
jgi:hypothetical protein